MNALVIVAPLGKATISILLCKPYIHLAIKDHSEYELSIPFSLFTEVKSSRKHASSEFVYRGKCYITVTSVFALVHVHGVKTSVTFIANLNSVTYISYHHYVNSAGSAALDVLQYGCVKKASRESLCD